MAQNDSVFVLFKKLQATVVEDQTWEIYMKQVINLK